MTIDAEVTNVESRYNLAVFKIIICSSLQRLAIGRRFYRPIVLDRI